MKINLMKTKMHLLSKLTFALLLVVAIACNNNDDDDQPDISDYDTVKTQYDSNYWANTHPKTYYLNNDVTWMTGENGQGNANPNVTTTYNSAILSTIDQNMKALGYSKIDTVNLKDPKKTPDLVLTAKAVATTYTQDDYYWNYTDWWDIYDPYYPWDGGGYYYPVIYQWTQGTVIVEMGDTKSINVANKKITIVWAGAINGLVRSTQTGNVSFIQERISQIFDDSPYLKVN